MTKIYSVVAIKGGILKTSLVVNISAELSKKNRILIVDSDGQSNVAVTFGVRDSEIKHTLFDCLASGIDIRDAIINVGENLDIIPAGKGMNSFIKKAGRSVKDLKSAIETIKDDYQYVFLDTTPSMNFATLQVMVASDEIIIPFQAEGYGIASIVDTIKAIREVKNSINPSLRINNVVVTKYDSRSKVHRKFLQDIQMVTSRLEIPLASTRIPQTITGANSILEEQVPVVLSKKWSRLKGIYSNLTQEIIING